MLVAHAYGLGTCWIGLAQDWLGTTEGRRAIGVSDEFLPVAPIIVGHPAGSVPPVPRNPAGCDGLIDQENYTAGVPSRGREPNPQRNMPDQASSKSP